MSEWPRFCAALLLLNGCGVPTFFNSRPAKTMPTPEVSEIPPKLRTTPPPLTSGKGRIVFDCVGRRCSVTEVLSRSGFQASGPTGSAFGSGGSVRQICDDTPCWGDFDYGPHTFRIVPLDVPSCWRDDFMDFKAEGFCFNDDLPYDLTLPASTKPVVLLARPLIEKHLPKQNIREVYPERHVFFEVSPDGPYSPPK